MGLMDDPTSGAHLVLTPHPVTLDGQRHMVAELAPGEMLGQYLRRVVPDWADDAWEVRINGVLVPVEVMERVRPKPGAIIEVRGIVKRQVLAIVAMAALTYFTFGGGAIAGWSLGTATAFGTSMVQSIAFMAGATLINKVLGPKLPRAAGGQQTDPVYSIETARNAPRPYEPLPLLLGDEVRITPDVASAPYAWYEGNDQYLGMVLTPGINVHSIEDLYNGDTPLSSYEGVQIYLNGFPGHPNQEIPLFSNADTIAGGELEPGGAWVERTGALDTVQLQLDFEGVLYDIDGKGRPAWNKVTIAIQYRQVGAGSWTSGPSLTISNNNLNVIRRTVSINVPRGQYEVRAQCGTPTWNDGSPHDDCRFTWVALKSIQYDDTDYTGIPRIGIKIKATGQLNGALDEVRCVAHSRPVPVWDGSVWTTEHTSNPGAHLLAYARGIYDTNGRLLAGIGLADSQIDIPALQAFMLHCEANGYTYDAYIKDARTHQEMVNAIALAGFGHVSWAGGKFSVVWAAAGQPITSVVNMANIKRASFQVDYTLANGADGIEATYVDASDWTTKTLRVEAPGVTTMQNPARITLEGVTDEEHAAKLARYHLAQHLYQYKDIRFAQDLEYLSYRRMSVLALSHDMTQWGYGGRVLAAQVSAGTVMIALDQSVPAPTSGNAYVGLRIPGEGAYRVFQVAPFSGESDTLTLTDPWPGDAPLPGDDVDNPAHDTLWIYDFKSTPGYRVRVVQIEPESDLRGARVAVVPESPEFWTYVETGEYTPPAGGSQLLTRPVASNLRIAELQTVQGDTVFTELQATFDVTGPMAYATIHLAQQVDGAWSEVRQVAETRTQQARFRIPGAGVYSITVRPYNADGIVGGAVSTTYVTTNADIPPPPFDSVSVTDAGAGVRKYSWSYDSNTIQAPDFAGAEVRYIVGTPASPDWDDMAPVVGDGFHTAPFEALTPVAGTYTFAFRARNTAGDLSEYTLTTATLGSTLGENMDELTQDLVAAQMALDQEIADRIAGDLATASAAAADATAKANAALASAMAAISSLEAELAEITGAPEWDIAETYDPGDLVKYDGALYRALVQTTGDQPDISPTEWEKVGDYTSLGEAVAAALSLATTTADELAAQVNRIDAIVARMPAGTGELATTAFVASEMSAIVSDLEAEANRIDAIVARMPAGTGQLATAASVSSEASARASADSALSNRVDVVEARMPAGSGELATASALNSLDGRVTNAEGQITAQGSALTQVSARLDSAQMVINGGFEDATSGWSASESAANARTFGLPNGFAITDATDVAASGSRGLRILASTTANRVCWGWLRTPVTPGETIYARFMGRITTAGGPPPDNGLVVRIALRWYTASGTYISNSWVASMTSAGSTVPYTEYSGSAVVPSTAAFVRVILQVSGTQTTGQFCVDDIVVQRMGPAQAAQASAVQSLDSRVTSVEGTVSAHSSALTSVSADLGNVQASVTELMEVSASDSNSLVILDPGFELRNGWELPAEVNYSTASPQSGAYCLRFNGSTASRYVRNVGITQVRPGQRIRFRFWTRATGGVASNAVARFGVTRYDQSGANLESNTHLWSLSSIPNHGHTLREVTWTVPNDTFAIRVYCATTNGVGASANFYFDNISAQVVDENLDSRVRAMHTVALNVNGHISGTVNENDGQTSSFSILATVFRVISTVTGMGMEWQDGYLRIWRGSAQLVIGHNFGSGNLVFWYGPNVGAGSCTKANGTIWFDTSGGAYFGGSLSAGVLHNASQSSTLGSSAVAVIGPFGTNGNPKTVVSSFTYQNAGYLSGNHTSLNGQSVSATVVVERSLNSGSTWAQISTYTATGNIVATYDGEHSRTFIQFPDFFGSTTSTDTNTSTNNFMYRSRITGVSGSWPIVLTSGQGTQRLSIASTES